METVVHIRTGFLVHNDSIPIVQTPNGNLGLSYGLRVHQNKYGRKWYRWKGGSLRVTFPPVALF